MATTDRGEGVWLLPASRWAEYKLPPQLLPRSVSHQMDWVRACKGGQPGCSNFDISVPYIEWLVLGAIALRVPGKLLWDAKNMRFTNNDEANKYIKPYIRKGWELKLELPGAQPLEQLLETMVLVEPLEGSSHSGAGRS